MIITKTYPLKSLTVEEATELQFYIVDCITRNMSGREMLSRGDLGVVSGKNKPIITEKAERVIAEVFDTEACMLVRGAGSGSIRMGLLQYFIREIQYLFIRLLYIIRQKHH